jgi:AraC-like DNA-binding protein
MQTSQILRKPTLEKVNPEFGSSFSVKHYTDPCEKAEIPFWHFHPEIELVYVKGGSGKRHIGKHMSYYQSGELVLIGSMLPHTGFTDRLSGNESESVIQFHKDFVGPQFFESHEMRDIQQLFERAKSGLAFHGGAKQAIGQRIEKLVTLDYFGKFIELLCILQDLAWADQYEILNADGYAMEIENSNNDRMNIIYDFVRNNFHRSIPLDEIANVASMTVPAFCRYFKRASGKTFTQFVNEFRIVHACKLLTEKQITISNVCFECGYNNFSHFNRSFKEITGVSPSNYRKQFKTVLQD